MRHSWIKTAFFPKAALAPLAAFAASLLLASCGNAEEAGSEKGGIHTDAAMQSVSQNQSEAQNQPPETAMSTDAAAHEGGTWGDIVYGDVNAPVEIIEYASLTCPHCANFAQTIFPKIKEKYIDTGKVKFVYRNFVLNRLDLAASTAARCGDEKVSKALMKTMFARQNEWARSQNPIDELAAIVRKAGISRVQFDRCLADREMHEHLVAMTVAGQEDYQVNATPTIIVDGEKADSYGWEQLDTLLAEKF